jgi:ribosomal protein S27AE
MIVDFVFIFSAYVFLFLAIILGAWILSLWQQSRARSQSVKRYTCPCCGGVIRADQAVVAVRCGHCGARHEMSRLTAVTES